MHISPSFTSTAILQSIAGGVLIGAIAAARLHVTRTAMTCATPTVFMTSGTILFSLVFSQIKPIGDIYEPVDNADLITICIAAVLVGSGAKLGKGCTSGNGIQGLAALSPASFLHVCLFMFFGVLTASVLNTADTILDEGYESVPDLSGGAYAVLLAVSVGGIAGQYLRRREWSPSASPRVAALTDVLAGLSFASSLTLSNMSRRSKVVTFLDLVSDAGWDPSLAFVMGGGCAVTISSYHFLGLVEKSDAPFQSWARRPISWKLAIGGAMFGVGWALSGLCPGPALVVAGTLQWKGWAFVGLMFGSWLAIDKAMPEETCTQTAPQKAQEGNIAAEK